MLYLYGGMYIHIHSALGSQQRAGRGEQQRGGSGSRLSHATDDSC